MPGTRKRPKVVLCATLTADGKLDATAPALPPVLYGGGTDPARHPWDELYHGAAAVLVGSAMRKTLPMPQAAVRTVVSFDLGQAGAPQALARTLDDLRREGVTGNLLCFGGAELFRLLLAVNRVDELYLIVRPQIDGRRGSASLSGAGAEFFPASVACRLLGLESVGDECLLHYRVLRRAAAKRAAA